MYKAGSSDAAPLRSWIATVGSWRNSPSLMDLAGLLAQAGTAADSHLNPAKGRVTLRFFCTSTSQFMTATRLMPLRWGRSLIFQSDSRGLHSRPMESTLQLGIPIIWACIGFHSDYLCTLPNPALSKSILRAR